MAGVSTATVSRVLLAVGPRQPRAGGAGPQRRQDAELSAQPRRARLRARQGTTVGVLHPRHPEPLLHRHRPRHRRRNPEARGIPVLLANSDGSTDRERVYLEHVPRRRRGWACSLSLAGRRAHLPRLPADGRAARRAGPHGPPAERRPGVGHERGRVRAGRGSPGGARTPAHRDDRRARGAQRRRRAASRVHRRPRRRGPARRSRAHPRRRLRARGGAAGDARAARSA